MHPKFSIWCLFFMPKSDWKSIKSSVSVAILSLVNGCIEELASSVVLCSAVKDFLKFSYSNLKCASLGESSCIWKLLPCSVMKSCKRGKLEKNFYATRFCHRGMCLKRRFQFYTHTHNCIRHHDKYDLFKRDMLEFTWNHFEGCDKRPRMLCRPGVVPFCGSF